MKTIIRNGDNDKDYLIRWRVRLPFGWSIKLHHILLPDDDRCDHDHPWWFIRIILWGGYQEVQSWTEFLATDRRWTGRGTYGATYTAVRRARKVDIKPWRPWAPWRVYFCNAAFTHRILAHRLPGGTWSLGLYGRKARTWGFFTKSGWKHWEEFLKGDSKKRTAWCEGE